MRIFQKKSEKNVNWSLFSCICLLHFWLANMTLGSGMYFCHRKKMWFIININEPHWPLDFCACALDNKLMTVYSWKYHLSKSCFFLSNSPRELESQRFFSIHPVYTEKGNQILKKSQRETVKSLEIFSLFWMAAKSIRPSSFQHSSVQCPKQMVRRSVQRCDFVTQVQPNGSVGSVDGYLEKTSQLSKVSIASSTPAVSYRCLAHDEDFCEEKEKKMNLWTVGKELPQSFPLMKFQKKKG